MNVLTYITNCQQHSTYYAPHLFTEDPQVKTVPLQGIQNIFVRKQQGAKHLTINYYVHPEDFHPL